MKKILIVIISLVLLVILSFFAYSALVYGKSDTQKIQTNEVDFILPENWGKIEKGSEDQNCGYDYWTSDKNGVGEFAGVSFKFIVNNNDCGGDCEVNLSNILIYDFEEIRMLDPEYISKNGSDQFESFEFKGRPALRSTYILKDSEENAGSSNKKGEIISVDCGSKCIIFYFESFEENWDKNKADWDFIQKMIEFKIK